MKFKNVALLILITLSHCYVCKGQNVPDTSRIIRIETTDGNIYTGTIISEDLNTLVLKTENLGELRIRQPDIKSRTELKEFTRKDGNIWLPNPQSSRYFWAPNGYGLESGSGYYQNIWVLYNQFSLGITNYFSVGAGVLPLFLFAGTSSPAWIVPKFSIPVVRDKVNIGTGGLLGTIIGEDASFGLLYETTTFGSRDRNFSLGFAYGFAQDNWMKRPVINFSAMIRTGPKGYFITENYLIPYENDFANTKKYAAFLSLGGRSIIRNIGLDYSLWIPIDSDMDSFIAIPFLGISVPFGKKAGK